MTASPPAAAAWRASAAAARLPSWFTPATMIASPPAARAVISTTRAFSSRSRAKFSPAWPLHRMPLIPGTEATAVTCAAIAASSSRKSGVSGQIVAA